MVGWVVERTHYAVSSRDTNSAKALKSNRLDQNGLLDAWHLLPSEMMQRRFACWHYGRFCFH